MMRASVMPVLLLLCAVLAGCSGNGNTQATVTVMPVTVGKCGPGTYLNEPCVSVTVCSPGTTSCQTIPNVLLDTGSFGLRVFASVVSVKLSPERDRSGRILAECSPYADGTSDWGPIELADVVLGGSRAPSVPVQLIEADFGTLPSTCSKPDQSPQISGYNGILGVGVFTADCGSNCSRNSQNGVYYACNNYGCLGTSVPESFQVSNPVAYLPTNNNGVALQLPSVPPGGAASVEGSLYIGIPSPSQQVTVFPTDGNGDFVTEFQGYTYTSSFIDSGSNHLYFPPTGSLPPCPQSGDAAGYYCPPSVEKLSAVQIGANFSPQLNVFFDVLSGLVAAGSSNLVFSDVAAQTSDGFDWGLPFFLGRTVYVGIEGRPSSLGVGPYWAY